LNEHTTAVVIENESFFIDRDRLALEIGLSKIYHHRAMSLSLVLTTTVVIRFLVEFSNRNI
jgi:hypothetical protein